jgi:hypothetical protein
MRTISLLALCGAASTLLSCTQNTAPTAPAGDVEAAASAINNGLSICSWGLGDFTGNGSISYLVSDMNGEGAYEIVFYSPPGSTSYITSNPTPGLTTVYRDTLVVINGSLPSTEHSSGGSTAITLAVDLRLVVTPHRGTGLHPVQGGKGGEVYTRYMNLSGTISGVQITSGSGIADVPTMGRNRQLTPPPRRATPFNWLYGLNGSVQFCTH